MSRIAGLLIALLSLAQMSGCGKSTEIVRLDGPTMGTTWSARFAAHRAIDREVVLQAIRTELEDVVVQMSTWRRDSLISRYNNAAAGTWHELPESFAIVLEAALALAAATGGHYDPTVGPLVDLWGFGPGGRRDKPPAAADIAAAKARVGWQRIQFEAGTRRLLQPGGLRLDLSSIAEGFAVDRMGEALERLGIDAYLVEIGGELRARGKRPDGMPWRVAIEQPDSGDVPVTVVPLQDLSIATSGDYRKFFEFAGRRYSHAIDPHTGYPVQHGLAAVTVSASTCMEAGSTATALSVLGPQRGFDYAVRNDIAARLVIRDGPSGFTVRETPAFTALVDAH
ncbi:FAD:protein FMN transferase [Pseudofulvimonas gallinarii]|uniref:FAD:protein FMN transferase n=1 Tax=Pseudofulvimonas gallinarii TaxID=634155 RepID=A0A4R3LSN4_9GAMM|nr:FAD:protein FMN transferase [Pseudofulvimonas gallinarii]TCT01247.1 thiamine biosynthesis lipoprotein [Pseudofulvimonas gallinarii]